MKVQITLYPSWKKQILGGGKQCGISPAKVREPVKLPFWVGELSGPKESCYQLGVHIGATWQIWLDECVWWLLMGLPPQVVRQPVSKLLWAILLNLKATE